MTTIKIYLTEKQKQVYDLYVIEGLNQKQIAEKIYGDSKRQGEVSNIMKHLSKKLGVDLIKAYPKRKDLQLYEVKIPD